MTRRICMLLTALLLLSGAATAATLTVPDVLTLTYPDGWDDYGADDRDDVKDEYYNLGFICGPGDTDLNVSIDLFYFPEYADLRLFELDEQATLDYADMLIEEYENATLLEIRRVGAQEIPFAILEAEDAYGPCYYAETLTNCWDLCLSAYAYADSSYDTARLLSRAELEVFLGIVDSIVPIVN